MRRDAAARVRVARSEGASRVGVLAAAASWIVAFCVAGLPAGSAAAVDLQGHRGARGLAPENTLAAFDLAIGLGVDTLELDVAITRDDVAVVVHDRTLNPDLVRDARGRWLDGRGPSIRALDLAALRAYDVGRLRPGSAYADAHPAQRPVDGERIPTLPEVFELARRRGADRIRFNVETKLSPLAPTEAADPDTFVRVIVAAIREAGVASRTTIQSFDWRTLRGVRRVAPEIATAHLSSRRPGLDTVRADDPAGSPWTDGLRFGDHGSVARMVRAAGGTTWSPDARDLDAQAVAEARALGLKVVPWTVNDAPTMHRLIDWGVDGLITDRPDVLRDVLVERGLRPAARSR